MSRSNQIYFDHPGDFGLWEQTCLPIGNGYMGASMFGGIKTERIVLNEKTFWAGGPCENRPDYYGGNHRDRYKYVKQVPPGTLNSGGRHTLAIPRELSRADSPLRSRAG